MLIRVDGREGMSMYPRLLPGATLLIDRHYNSLKSYRKGEFNMYAVLKDGSCTVKYVETANHHLILRPHNQEFPIEVMTMEEGKSASDYWSDAYATWALKPSSNRIPLAFSN